ncbi:hypothetical protein MANES_14G072000v8 [Manihot esculenta]|uniref:Uncharacterized protein n=1 Tax=Manihot esculenta TaxID=3983 RepID=A0A2C9UKL4_MANES|nr:hypothetical protein MANES_14G072000v8 [Manihot esculenta]
MSRKVRSNDSLCEKSMKMVVSIIKLSSFSIAKMSLGATEPAVVTKKLAPVTGSVMDANGPLLPQIPRSHKSQQVRSRSKPFSFVMQPDEGNSSAYTIHEENSVIDGMASDYIRKFHEKNSYDAHFHEISNLSAYRPTPPSRAVK